MIDGIDKRGSTIDNDVAFFCARFELTIAQARLAAFLSKGGTLAEYASMTGIKTSTVRSHLKAIFQKVGVKRQAELVVRLLEKA